MASTLPPAPRPNAPPLALTVPPEISISCAPPPCAQSLWREGPPPIAASAKFSGRSVELMRVRAVIVPPVILKWRRMPPRWVAAMRPPVPPPIAAAWTPSATSVPPFIVKDSMSAPRVL